MNVATYNRVGYVFKLENTHGSQLHYYKVIHMVMLTLLLDDWLLGSNDPLRCALFIRPLITSVMKGSFTGLASAISF